MASSSGTQPTANRSGAAVHAAHPTSAAGASGAHGSSRGGSGPSSHTSGAAVSTTASSSALRPVGVEYLRSTLQTIESNVADGEFAVPIFINAC